MPRVSFYTPFAGEVVLGESEEDLDDRAAWRQMTHRNRELAQHLVAMATLVPALGDAAQEQGIDAFSETVAEYLDAEHDLDMEALRGGSEAGPAATAEPV